MRKSSRITRFLMRELIRRQSPHGLVSWRYLWPGADTRIRWHRKFWWYGRTHWPRWLWLALETLLWLRWIGFSAWRSTWQVVFRLGPEIQQREGLSIATQLWRVIGLALGWCVPPIEAYRFQLYRKPELALDYVFDQETTGYHHCCSLPLGLSRDSLTLLQDKVQQTESLAKLGVPMAPILACVPRHSSSTLLHWLNTIQDTRVFCKTRSGNKGLGAFEAWHTATGHVGRMFDGRLLNNHEDVEKAWRELVALDDVLVQPALQNHPTLAPLARVDTAITIRFISRQASSNQPSLAHHDAHAIKLTCLYATLELPAGAHEKTGRIFYTFLPVDATTGKVLPYSKENWLPHAQAHINHTEKQLTADFVVRYWPELREESFRAHTRFPDIATIAWDWVITPDGPLLLEGNFGWGTSNVQIFNGGLLNQSFWPE